MYSLTLSAIALAALASVHAGSLQARQDFDINFGDSRGEINGTIPIECIEGCLLPFYNLGSCAYADNRNGSCQYACDSYNYTNTVQCLNCLIANGETDYSEIVSPQAALTNLTNACSSFSHPISSTTQLTATATQTGPFTATWSGNTYSPPTWTGLTAYVQALNDTGLPSASTSGGAGGSGRPSGGASMTKSGSSASGSATSAASASAASSAAASATTKSGASSSHNLSGAWTGLAGVAAVLGLVLA